MARTKVGMARTCYQKSRRPPGRILRDDSSSGISTIDSRRQLNNNAWAKMLTLRDARKQASDRQFGDFPSDSCTHITDRQPASRQECYETSSGGGERLYACDGRVWIHDRDATSSPHQPQPRKRFANHFTDDDKSSIDEDAMEAAGRGQGGDADAAENLPPALRAIWRN